ncbi:hypothetical protein C0J45_9889 [Silurus meridionalis]|nr:hypothetical protein C0J45_9889 [Silurus meridionalis]
MAAYLLLFTLQLLFGGSNNGSSSEASDSQPPARNVNDWIRNVIVMCVCFVSVLITICMCVFCSRVLDPISADPPITVEAHVGSTALLPCTLSKDFTQTSVIRWRAYIEVVFERSIDGTHEGAGYKGRVDVPEDELRKGNCSLVLKDVRITDHAFYTSFVLEHIDAPDTNKIQEINGVQLDVFQSVSAQVGSTAVLPCDWRHLSIQTPHVEWRIGDEIVFERLGKESFQGEGYEGRVDVPEEELLKGNCVLVLKNVSVTDETLYSSYMVVRNINKLVQNIKLSVRVTEKPEKRKDDPSAPSALNYLQDLRTEGMVLIYNGSVTN